MALQQQAQARKRVSEEGQHPRLKAALDRGPLAGRRPTTNPAGPGRGSWFRAHLQGSTSSPRPHPRPGRRRSGQHSAGTGQTARSTAQLGDTPATVSEKDGEARVKQGTNASAATAQPRRNAGTPIAQGACLLAGERQHTSTCNPVSQPTVRSAAPRRGAGTALSSTAWRTPTLSPGGTRVLAPER